MFPHPIHFVYGVFQCGASDVKKLLRKSTFAVRGYHQSLKISLGSNITVGQDIVCFVTVYNIVRWASVTGKYSH